MGSQRGNYVWNDSIFFHMEDLNSTKINHKEMGSRSKRIKSNSSFELQI